MKLSYIIKTNIYIIFLLLSGFTKIEAAVGVKTNKKLDLEGLNIYINIDSRSISQSRSDTYAATVTSVEDKDLKSMLSETFLHEHIERLERCTKALGEHINNFGSYAKRNKYWTLILGLGSLYSYSFYKISKLQKIIYSKKSWSNWRI